MRPTRRDVVTGIGGIAIATIGLNTLSDTSQATQIEVKDLSIPDKQADVSSPVTSVRLSVSGEYSVDSEVVPTRVILRLEAKRSTNTEWTQLDAGEPGSLAKEFSESFDYQGNLLDCPEITAPGLSPADVGDTKAIAVDVRLKLIVKHDGKILQERAITESIQIQTEKTLSNVTIGMDASGNISVSD